MPEEGRTIYKTCREQAGYTQEHAAELLGCSVRALARHESGEVLPSNAVAYRMAQLYNSQFLAFDHLRRSSELAAALLPPVEDCDFQTAVLRFFNQLEGLEVIGRQLLKIAEDDKVDAGERPVMEEIILPRLERITGAITEIRLAAGKSSDT